MYIIENEKLMAEWDWEKNNELGLNPEKLTYGSNKKVWWVCAGGHKYQQTINKRTTRKYGCPYCSGHKVLTGYNDLKTLFPELADEWNYAKNDTLTPDIISKGSGKKVWWKCPIGHEYKSTIKDRVYSKTNCPICNKIHTTSFPEQAIMFYVKKLFPDAINKYKDIFTNSMELDIYIPSANTGIEFDGSVWHKTEDQHQRELKKYEICKKNNIFLFRIKERGDSAWEDTADHTVFIEKTKNYEQLTSALRELFNHLYNMVLLKDVTNIHSWESYSIKPNMYNPLLSVKKTVNPLEFYLDINLERDRTEIQSYLTKADNSLLEQRPDIRDEWNYEKNGTLTPDMFSEHSNESVWWKCKICGREWKTQINHRTRRNGSGCAVCAVEKRGKDFTKTKIKERGSLAENSPELILEWNYEKNKITPYDIMLSSNKKVWWKCSKCGYEWESSPNNKKRGGCPACSGLVAVKGKNDLLTLNPELAKEWNEEKNIGLSPADFKSKSGKKVWWKCSKCGNEWLAEIRSRTNGSGCPRCNALKRNGLLENQQSLFDNEL